MERPGPDRVRGGAPHVYAPPPARVCLSVLRYILLVHAVRPPEYIGLVNESAFVVSK